VFSLWLLKAMNSSYIGQVGAMRASCSVVCHRRPGDTVLGFDWFFRWIRRLGVVCCTHVLLDMKKPTKFRSKL